MRYVQVSVVIQLECSRANAVHDGIYRFRVPLYEKRKGEFSPTLNRRDATVKAHAKRMNRLLAAKRSDVGVADCPVIPRDEVTASIRHPIDLYRLKKPDGCV